MHTSQYEFGQNRPQRTCEETRRFAYESMHGKYGDDAMRHPFVSLDEIADFDDLSPLEQYDAAIRKICEDAPVRICEHERISGAATLGAAITAAIPAFRGQNAVLPHISHVTLGFGKALRLGILGMEEELDTYIRKFGENELRRSLKNTIDSFKIWHGRYLAAAGGEIRANLQRVPLLPPAGFYEAVQALWFLFAFTRLCGNWPGIGRIDEMLGGYLKQDLHGGKITLEEAREILAHFFITGCEWIVSDTPRGSGDAQHYQNLILGGTNGAGEEVTNEVTYLVLDIIEEFGISDFPVTIRVHAKTPEKLLHRAAEVVRLGGGVIAFYNEDLIIRSLTAMGYAEKEARNFANDGCWEVQIPGKTDFFYMPFDALNILLKQTLGLDSAHPAEFSSFEELYTCFRKNLEDQIALLYRNQVLGLFDEIGAEKRLKWKANAPCSVVSLFTEGCAERGLSYLEGGPIYHIASPHIGGAPDTGNSLYAIQKLVFEEQKVSLAELAEILRNNWEGSEQLRLYVKNHYTYYGNDDDEADSFTVRVLEDFADIVLAFNQTSPVSFFPGVSTFGRQAGWAHSRGAAPFGTKKGEILSGNTSPTPMTDFCGATSIIKSYCKIPLVKMASGAALDLALHPSVFSEQSGTEAFADLIRGFCRLGGFFLQPDTVDPALLRRAQEDPAAYKTLSVRVSGWNARFITLDREWQEMIIEKNESGALL